MTMLLKRRKKGGAEKTSSSSSSNEETSITRSEWHWKLAATTTVITLLLLILATIALKSLPQNCISSSSSNRNSRESNQAKGSSRLSIPPLSGAISRLHTIEDDDDDESNGLLKPFEKRRRRILSRRSLSESTNNDATQLSDDHDELAVGNYGDQLSSFSNSDDTDSSGSSSATSNRVMDLTDWPELDGEIEVGNEFYIYTPRSDEMLMSWSGTGAGTGTGTGADRSSSLKSNNQPPLPVKSQQIERTTAKVGSLIKSDEDVSKLTSTNSRRISNLRQPANEFQQNQNDQEENKEVRVALQLANANKNNINDQEKEKKNEIVEQQRVSDGNANSLVRTNFTLPDLGSSLQNSHSHLQQEQQISTNPSKLQLVPTKIKTVEENNIQQVAAASNQANSAQNVSPSPATIGSGSGSGSGIELPPPPPPLLSSSSNDFDPLDGNSSPLPVPNGRINLHQRPYCIGHKDSESIFNWLCQGIQLIKVPVDLYPKPMSLRLSNTGIETLTYRSLSYYKETLRDFSIENAPRLLTIEAGTFAQLIRLRVVYIFLAPKLISFDYAVSGLHPELTIIRIQQTGLRRWPDFSQFNQERILTSVDLDNNKIASLGAQPINIRTELLNLEFNYISSIEKHTFNGSEIGVLSLSGNRQLSFIHRDAFSNLKNLIKLDLSSTSVTQLPPVGLHQLRTLIIRDTYTLKRIPSIYVFPMLEVAHLTYAYHCCSFRYPQTHDPSAYESHLRLQEEINALCANKRDESDSSTVEDSPENDEEIAAAAAAASSTAATAPAAGSNSGKLLLQQQTKQVTQSSTPPNSDFEGYFEPNAPGAHQESASNNKIDSTASGASTISEASGVIPTVELAPMISTTTTTTTTTSRPPLSSKGGRLLVDRGRLTTTHPPAAASSEQVKHHNRLSFESNSSSSSASTPNLKKLWLMHNIECGELAIKHGGFQNITCTPEPDAFNPCEDIMGYSVLRVAVWFVVGASVFGNLSVIVVLMGVFRRLSVPKFLQLNLAIGDLFMGVYLAMLALADLTTVGAYFNYAIDWQHGYGCKVAGAASLFASQLSIFTLSVITFERYYTITYSIDLNMRLQISWAARIMFLGWIYAFASAMLPIFADINSYTKTSICLPMRTTFFADRLFIIVLLIIDSSAFVIIFACYLKMYLLIIRQKTEATAKERTVAMRMALLVSTDFACWAPIIFFGTTAFFGQPLISVTNSKILIVFFYPLNSMANPFLYVISTRQYRRDLNYLTSRWHMWRKNLFKRNNDSFYSNNAYGGISGLQYPGGLNAQLGAVAAVTGVASHLRHNHIGFPGGLLLGCEEGAHLGVGVGGGGEGNGLLAPIKLHEQRVICTKAHQGQYIIRHQILTDRQLPLQGGRGGHCGGRSTRFKFSRGSGAPAPAATAARQQQQQQQQQRIAQTATHGNDQQVSTIKNGNNQAKQQLANNRGQTVVDCSNKNRLCVENHQHLGTGSSVSDLSCASKVVNLSGGRTSTNSSQVSETAAAIVHIVDNDETTSDNLNDSVDLIVEHRQARDRSGSHQFDISGACELTLVGCSATKGLLATRQQKQQQQKRHGTLKRYSVCCAGDDSRLLAPASKQSLSPSKPATTSSRASSGRYCSQCCPCCSSSPINSSQCSILPGQQQHQPELDQSMDPISGVSLVRQLCNTNKHNHHEHYSPVVTMLTSLPLNSTEQKESNKEEGNHSVVIDDRTTFVSKKCSRNSHSRYHPPIKARPIDILGNMSYNEPTSSFSGVSSTLTQDQGQESNALPAEVTCATPTDRVKQRNDDDDHHHHDSTYNVCQHQHRRLNGGHHKHTRSRGCNHHHHHHHHNRSSNDNNNNKNHHNHHHHRRQNHQRRCHHNQRAQSNNCVESQIEDTEQEQPTVGARPATPSSDVVDLMSCSLALSDFSTTNMSNESSATATANVDLKQQQQEQIELIQGRTNCQHNNNNHHHHRHNQSYHRHYHHHHRHSHHHHQQNHLHLHKPLHRVHHNHYHPHSHNSHSQNNHISEQQDTQLNSNFLKDSDNQETLRVLLLPNQTEQQSDGDRLKLDEFVVENAAERLSSADSEQQTTMIDRTQIDSSIDKQPNNKKKEDDTSPALVSSSTTTISAEQQLPKQRKELESILKSTVKFGNSEQQQQQQPFIRKKLFGLFKGSSFQGGDCDDSNNNETTHPETQRRKKRVSIMASNHSR